MYKYIIVSFLVFGMGLLPLVANSSMGKRIQEAQSVFPMERIFLTSLVENLLASSSEVNAASQSLYNPELELDYENSEINTSTIGIIQTIDWSDKCGGRSKIALFNKKCNQVRAWS